MPRKKPITTIEEFNQRVRKTDTCWLWMLARDKDGYGNCSFMGEKRRAHRVAWMLYHGQLLDEEWVLHTCDNPSCVNPSHLFLGDAQTNVDDKIAKGRDPRSRGYRHSDETRAKIGRSNSGKPNAKKGTLCSDETLARMSAAQKGHKVSLGARANMRAAALARFQRKGEREKASQGGKTGAAARWGIKTEARSRSECQP